MSTLRYVHRSLQASIIGWLMTMALLIVLIRHDDDDVALRKSALLVLAASQAGRILDDIANPYDSTTYSSPIARAMFATASSAWILPLSLLSASHAAVTASVALAGMSGLVAFGAMLAMFRMHRRLVPSDYVADEDRAPPFAGWSAFGTLVSAPFVAALNTVLFAMYFHYPLVGPRCGLSLPPDQCSPAVVYFARASMPAPGSTVPVLDSVAAALCDTAEVYGNAVIQRSALLVLASLLLWYKCAIAHALFRLVAPDAIGRLVCRTATLLSSLWLVLHSIASAPLLIAVFGSFARYLIVPYAPALASLFSAIVPMRVSIDLQDAIVPTVAWAHGHDSVDQFLAAMSRSACTLFSLKESIHF